LDAFVVLNELKRRAVDNVSESNTNPSLVVWTFIRKTFSLKI
jgi:hypothetical protein